MENEMQEKHPLRALGLDSAMAGEGVSRGLLMARAGLGKTAILVQFALDCMLQGNNVLHVAIGEGLDKTRDWYSDMLATITDGEKLENIPGIMRQRMIMTFKESAFSRVLLQERLDDLVEQDIFRPDCLIVDGYDFTGSSEKLTELCSYMAERGLRMIWFSAVSHRDDERRSEKGIPAPGHEVEDLFDNILLIRPQGEEISLDILKCDSKTVSAGVSLKLDPSTMLLKKG